MKDPKPTTARSDRIVLELPMQRATREDLLAGMCGIIRRMTRHCGTHPQTGLEVLCLCSMTAKQTTNETIRKLAERMAIKQGVIEESTTLE